MKNYTDNEILELICSAEREAAELILQAKHVISESKSSGRDIVTQYDRKVQELLVERFSSAVEGARFFCEENDEQDELNAEHVFIIDPIDGTMNYARGVGISAISVALVRQGDPLLGVVYDPYRKEMFWAQKGMGAWCNGKPIRTSCASFAESLFCVAWSTYNKSYAPQCLAVTEEVYAQCNDFRRFGSCALEVCYLAAGRCDLFFEFRISPWDWAAAGRILMEAGGVITGFEDCLPPHDRTTMLMAANNRSNYEQLRQIVLKHVPELPYKEILL